MDTERSWWTKMRRAVEHILAFQAAADPCLALRPEDLTLDGPTEIGEGLYFERGVTFATRPLPPRLAAIAGDAFHNVRTALDHLAVCLTSNPSGVFPIVTDWLKHTKHYDDNVKGAPAGAVAIIRACQPVNSAEPLLHPLAVLRKLDNSDKHRALLVVGSLHRATSTDARNATGAASLHDVRLGDGVGGRGKQELFSFGATLPPGEKLEVRVEMSSEVIFAETGPLDGQNVLRVFDEVMTFAQRLIVDLEKFVPASPGS